MTGDHGFASHRDLVAGGRFLRVVNYHNTPASTAASVHRELEVYRERFDPVDLAELDTFFATGRWSGDRPGLLPVFYEGYRNSYDVAVPACDDTGFTGWFPVCTGFVSCPVGEQELFARSHFIDLVPEELTGERIALSTDELAEMASRHVVFPHTASHVGIADVVTDDDLHREIVEPKRVLDAITGQDCAAFVWLHGSPWGGRPRVDGALLGAGYRYLFSNTMIQRIR
ncbi:polysaccharide deacetylase family protein [Nakamurella deserti]|uniref:polysaccharide deacetylase family protein n=1 Tax=Nakamurella deserti TaxID=2164074 RepID=UPI000DBE71A0|nr:polysaccharide deacetylase family protein [Nakamurella deserti]